MDDLDVIRQAILNEVEGMAFYDLAAQRTSNPEVKEALIFLKDQEADHEEWLKNLFERLLQKKHFEVEYVTWLGIQHKRQSEREKRGKSPELFAKAKEQFQDGKLLQTATMDLAVFKVGTLMEQAAIDFYSQAAEKTSTPEAKALYEHLVKWEKEHLNTLNEIHETLSKVWLENYEFFYSHDM